MMQEFANEGHSGFSASYAISILTKLMDFKPLSPLTGEDDEWNNISEKINIFWEKVEKFKMLPVEKIKVIDDDD